MSSWQFPCAPKKTVSMSPLRSAGRLYGLCSSCGASGPGMGGLVPHVSTTVVLSPAHCPPDLPAGQAAVVLEQREALGELGLLVGPRGSTLAALIS